MVIRYFCDHCKSNYCCNMISALKEFERVFAQNYPNIILDISCKKFESKETFAVGFGTNNLIFDDDNLKQCKDCIHNQSCQHKPIKEINQLRNHLSNISDNNINISVACKAFFKDNNSNPNNQCIIGIYANNFDDKFIIGQRNISKVKIRRIIKKRR